ncbi:MAG: serine/threonine protein kinase [Planctomycetes bacterium]|nr:serine/threonine protein kinase [Planctomycetota bacterium]
MTAHDGSTDRPGDDALLDSLLADYLQRAEAGEEVDVSRLCRSRPDLEPKLRRLIGRARGLPGGLTGLGDVAGTILHGRYRIGDRLGRGGMGVVYAATDLELGREVAVKVLSAEVSDDVERLTRFGREARALAAVEHAGIVTIHDLVEARPACLVMERIRGIDLGRFLAELAVRQQEPVPPDPMAVRAVARELLGLAEAELPQLFSRPWPALVASIGAAMADAVQAAHDAGVVHRDIKPGNFMIERSGRIVLLDFGLARLESDPRITMSQALIGTLAYMAPEQIDGAAVGPAADVHAIGATLFECLTLTRPFARPGSDLLDEIRYREPALPRTYRSRVPRDLEAILLRAMRKDPSRRYPSAAELGEELRRMLRFEPVRARPSRIPRPIRRVIGEIRHHAPPRWITAGLAVLIAIAVLVIGNLLGDSRASERQAEAEARRLRVVELRAGLAPTLGFSGTRQERLRSAQRERDVAALHELVHLEPEDVELRFLRWLALSDDDSVPARSTAADDRAVMTRSLGAPFADSIEAVCQAVRDKSLGDHAPVTLQDADRILQQLPSPVAGYERPAALIAARMRAILYLQLGRDGLASHAAAFLREARGEQTTFVSWVDATVRQLRGEVSPQLRDALRFVLQRCPGDLPTMHNLGKVLRLRGEFQEAEAVLTRALQTAPSHWRYANQLCLVLRDAGHFELAEERARVLLEGDRLTLVLADIEIWRHLRDPDLSDRRAELERAAAALEEIASRRDSVPGDLASGAETNAGLARAFLAGDLPRQVLHVLGSLCNQPGNTFLRSHLVYVLGGLAGERLPDDLELELRQGLLEFLAADALMRDPGDGSAARGLARSLVETFPAAAIAVLSPHVTVESAHESDRALLCSALQRLGVEERASAVEDLVDQGFPADWFD